MDNFESNNPIFLSQIYEPVPHTKVPSKLRSTLELTAHIKEALQSRGDRIQTSDRGTEYDTWHQTEGFPSRIIEPKDRRERRAHQVGIKE